MVENTPKKYRVITRKNPKDKNEASGFEFTREMIPMFSSNGTKQSAYQASYRKKAWDAFERLDLPNTSEEAWRRTDLRKLQTTKFVIANQNTANDLPEVPSGLSVSDDFGGSVELSPSGSKVNLSTSIAAQGVIFTDLATAANEHTKILDKILGHMVDVDDGKFAAMAGAFASQGALLYVPKGVQVEQPLHSIMWAPGEGLAHFSHILIWLEEQASVTYVHESVSPTENGQTLHSGIVEIHVGDAANLEFVELQKWGDNMWNFTHKHASIGNDAKLSWISGVVGSHLTKEFMEINLVGQGAIGRMSGFYFADGDQHFDLDTQQNHLAPNTTSDLLFKGALKGSSRSIWQGMINVAREAQKTDGYQSNPNLVLSKNARADSIPGLEILADDVRCTHGATVGNIDSEEIFYLRSRGIPKNDSERLIVEGFFSQVIERISIESTRDQFKQLIVDKLN